MTSPKSRDYAGPADLRAMQALAQALWPKERQFHIGGLAWQRFEHVGREADWPTRLWEADGRVVAWGWIYERDPDLLYFQVDPAFPALVAEVLDWFEGGARAAMLNIPVLDLHAARISALSARGYSAVGSGPFGLLNARDLAILPASTAREGMRLRSMADAPDPERRAAAHRAAWDRIAGRENDPPGASRVTAESYCAVMAAWPYRPDLDLVLEDAEGRWVANCCAWLDPVNGVGELEPVGVDADHRRQGLGHAVCLAALHSLRAVGAKGAIVGARGDDDYPVPRQLYFSLGFETYARTVTFERERGW